MTARVVTVGAPQTFRGQVARVLDIALEEIEWVPSVTAAEEYLGGRRDATEMVVMSPGVKEPDALGLAEFVGRVSPATAVVLVREGQLNGSLPEAMRAGIRDVVDLSRGGAELREALERAMTWSSNVRSVAGEARPPAETVRGTVISIFSSKGGTGKTFLATNLAAALAARSGKDTAVIDLELELGDVFSYFGQESKLTVDDLLAIGALAQRDQILSAGSRLGDHLWGYAVPSQPGIGAVSGEKIGKVLRAMRGAFAYTVVDASANYSDYSLAAFDVSDWIYLITGLDIVGVRHLSLAYRTLLSLGVSREKFRVALNRADSKVGLDPREVERVMRVQVDAEIPSSRLVPLSLNNGEPVFLSQPNSGVSKSIAALADNVIEMTAELSGATVPRAARRGRSKKR